MILGIVSLVLLLLLAVALCNAAGRESRWEERWRDYDDLDEADGSHEVRFDDDPL